MGHFPNPLAFANHLIRMKPRLAAAERLGLAQGARLIQKEAKSALGTYKYGWPQLKAATVARKRTGDKPLLETGALRDSIKVSVHGHRAEIYSDDPKAGYHEFGTRTIPPRPFLTTAAQLKEKEAVDAAVKPVLTVLSK